MKRIKSKLANKYVSRRWILSRHKLYTKLGHPTILVYTMGKVGSTSVYDTLKHYEISRLIYHVHLLSEKNTKPYFDRFKDTPYSEPKTIQLSKLVGGQFTHGQASWLMPQVKKPSPLYLISMLRDPVGTFFSHIFQNPKKHRKELIGSDGEVDAVKVQDYINDHFSDFEEDYISLWFGDEFLSYTGIDVYAHSFKTEDGYGIIEKNGFRVALLSLHNLNDNINPGLSDLLDKPLDLEVISSNIRADNEGADLYREIKNGVVIPRGDLERVYATRYARHFFSESQIDKLIDKWSSVRK